MRLIDADAFWDKLQELESWLYSDCTYDCLNRKLVVDLAQVERLIEEAPTIEERPRGEWINHLDLTEDYYGESKQCSLCGYKDYNTRRFSWHKFCPNCGADMRGEGE